MYYVMLFLVQVGVLVLYGLARILVAPGFSEYVEPIATCLFPSILTAISYLLFDLLKQNLLKTKEDLHESKTEAISSMSKVSSSLFRSET